MMIYSGGGVLEEEESGTNGGKTGKDGEEAVVDTGLLRVLLLQHVHCQLPCGRDEGWVRMVKGVESGKGEKKWV